MADAEYLLSHGWRHDQFCEFHWSHPRCPFAKWTLESAVALQRFDEQNSK